MKTITREMIVKREKYSPLPGQPYEIAKGVIATLREDTVENVERVNAIVRQQHKLDADGNPVTTSAGPVMEDRPLHEIALDQAKIILDVPPSFTDWSQASMKVVWRVCQDFLSLTLPTEQPET